MRGARTGADWRKLDDPGPERRGSQTVGGGRSQDAEEWKPRPCRVGASNVFCNIESFNEVTHALKKTHFCNRKIVGTLGLGRAAGFLMRFYVKDEDDPLEIKSIVV